MKHLFHHRLLFLIFCAVVLLISSILLQNVHAEDSGYEPYKPPAHWAILAGYGESHPGWGNTETRVKTVDIVVRRSILIVDELGSSWYRGRHSLLIELPLSYLPDYSDRPMVGISFLANYTFTETPAQPYIFAGGGPVYVGADIPGMGSELNGNYQIGAGVRFPLDNGSDFLVEFRYHHISNGGTSHPNDPLNSAKFLFGYTF